jgi:hypothetical protein
MLRKNGLELTSQGLKLTRARAHQLPGLERIHMTELTARQKSKKERIFLLLLGLEVLEDHELD